MKKLFKIFNAFVVAVGFSSFLNACNVNKAPEGETSSLESMTEEATEHVENALEETSEDLSEASDEVEEMAEHHEGQHH